MNYLTGRGGKIRTCGLTVPNRAHYQAVLRPVCFTMETIPSVEFYARKLQRSSQIAKKPRKNGIICKKARPRWLISRFIASGSSPKV